MDMEAEMKIAVIDPEGRMLTTYKILIGGLNYTPTENEAFDQARQSALDDGLVDEDAANGLTFRVIEEGTGE